MIKYFKTLNNGIAEIESLESGCWLNVVAPTKDEIDYLVETFDIDPDYVYAALDEEESSRVEVEDGKTLIIFDAPVHDKDGEELLYYTLPIGIIVTRENVITVSLHENKILAEFERGLVKNANTELKTQFVLTIILRCAARFLQYLKKIDKISSMLEKKLRKSMKNKELIQLLDIQKSLVYFSTSLKSNLTTLEKIMRGRYIKLYIEDQDLLEDVLIEIKQAADMSEIYVNILSGTMDAFASVISNNLNIVMKVLASVTIVLAIPQIIFSFYGMNVGGLPFSGSHVFPTVISLVIMGGLGVFLWRKEMF